MSIFNQCTQRCKFWQKIWLCLTILIFACMNLGAKEILSDYEQQAIDKVMEFRVSICSLNNDEALAKIDNFRNSILSETESKNYSEEVKLIIDTFLVLESYNYIYENNQQDKRIKPLILNQVQKLDAYFNEHNNETINKWLYCITGDAISCSLGLISTTDAMKRGLVIKKYYLKALEQDENFAMGLYNTAQWFFQAPAIGGGDKTKSKTYFEKALKVAKNNAEKYYALAFLSQSRFDNNNIEESASLLAQAEQLAPNSRMVLTMKKVNSVGYNYFYYIVHRDEVNKKLQKKYK